SAEQLARDEGQYKIGGIPKAQLDDNRALPASNPGPGRQLQSARARGAVPPPSRTEQIRAQEAQVAAARAALDQATWKLEQKAIGATRAGRVNDTLYREGEWGAAGNPGVKLL